MPHSADGILTARGVRHRRLRCRANTDAGVQTETYISFTVDSVEAAAVGALQTKTWLL